MRYILILIRAVLDYMYPKPTFKRVPKQLVNRYSMLDREVTEAERLLMSLNIARTPDNARALLDYYGVDNAYDLVQQLPSKRKKSLKSRIKRLLRRLDGHTSGDAYRCHYNENNSNLL